jgi:arsenate reductase
MHRQDLKENTMSKNAVIWHNPRCSKSRTTLSLLEERGASTDVVEYLKNPPTPQEIAHVLEMLGVSPRELMRKKEEVYGSLGLGNEALSSQDLIAAMAANPILIERPIVIVDGKAVIGRPPEQVATLF